ncbi:MAG: tyrosine-type recombinase/integrase [Chlorobi bacterium]|nr:tyrosine-type recombinase/integrase [Chlorobiota bacterium]MCI0715819.1 tyrosine-type recombinase/integrase [Chlorobiota bacterium]
MFISKGYKGIYNLYFKNPKTGKRTKISTGTRNQQEAYQFLRKFEKNEVMAINKSAPRHLTLTDLKNEILDYVKVNYEAKTFEVYSNTFKNILEYFGDKEIELLSLRDYEGYKAHRANLVSRTTVNIELRTLTAAFNIAVRFGLIRKNPISGVKQFSIPQKERLSLNNEELKIMIENIDNDLIKNIVLFALYTGCRITEIINVQHCDIDFKNRTLTIRNKPNFKTKSGKVRQIPICEGLNSLLENICSGKSGDNYLFSLKNNMKLRKDYVSWKFKKYLRKAGLSERFHFHCLRHTFITNLIKKDININFVKELAGHTQIQTTMSYIHIGINDLRTAVNSIKIAV